MFYFVFELYLIIVMGYDRGFALAVFEYWLFLSRSVVSGFSFLNVFGFLRKRFGMVLFIAFFPVVKRGLILCGVCLGMCNLICLYMF